MKRTATGTVTWDYELPESEPGVPNCVVATVNGESEYTASPGDPGCRYTRNGDGWPPTGPEVEIHTHRVKSITLDLTTPDGKQNEMVELPVPKDMQAKLGDMFYPLVDEDKLTDWVLEHAGDGDEPPDHRDY